MKKMVWTLHLGGSMGVSISFSEFVPRWFHRMAWKYLLGAEWTRKEREWDEEGELILPRVYCDEIWEDSGASEK